MMGSIKRKASIYVAFVAIVVLSLTLRRPQPDFIALDFVALAAGFGNILIGLGGFSITVLAVLLGLEALDAGRPTESRTVAHMAAVRHVAISLAIASISCFVGASLMAEVNALGAGVNAKKSEFRLGVETQLRAAGVSERRIAMTLNEMGTVSTAGPADPESVSPKINRILLGRAKELLGSRFTEMDRVLDSSIRRQFLLAGLPMYLASFLILQSLAFLLLIRFPRADRLHALQNLAVLGVGGMLLIKLLNAVSYGQSSFEFYFSRLVMLGIFVGVAAIYAPRTRRETAALEDPAVGRYTPLTPYYVSLGSSILAMFLLAATFSHFGTSTVLDRAVVGIGAVLSTAFMLVMQLEQPTIELLRRE